MYVARGVNLIEELERGDHLIIVFRRHPQSTAVFNARMPFGIFKASISIAMVASMPIAMGVSIKVFQYCYNGVVILR